VGYYVPRARGGDRCCSCRARRWGGAWGLRPPSLCFCLSIGGRQAHHQHHAANNRLNHTCTWRRAQVLDVLERFMQQEEFKYVRLDGSTNVSGPLLVCLANA